MKFSTDVYKLLKEEGAMRQSWAKLIVEIIFFLKADLSITLA